MASIFGNLLCCTLLANLTATSALAGADEVRNGGDHIRIIFNEGRSKAVEELKAFTPDAVSSHISASAKAWLVDNATKLAADLERSPLSWTEKLPDNCSDQLCACTGLTPTSVIHLSQQDCNARFVDSKYAAKLLIHEAVHHFGLTDESFADEIAIAVMDGAVQRPRYYASLGDPVALTTTAAPTLTDDGAHSIAFLLQQRGIITPSHGAGLSYTYRAPSKWAFEGSYLFAQTSYMTLIQTLGLGAKFYLSDRRIAPYTALRLSYEFFSYEDEDLATSKNYESGRSNLGAGIGLETRIWEQSRLMGDVERTLFSQGYYSGYEDRVTMPAAEWNLRLGVAVSFL